MKLEIAVQDAAGATIARAAGADRVELCAALGATGGLTPSAGTIEAAVATGVSVHVLIRARPGGYVFERDEIETMVADAAIARSLGAAGVVIGALTPDGAADVAALSAMAMAADGAELTFHRAIDTMAGRAARFELLDVLAQLGFARVLTSGGAARVGEGIGELAAMASFTHGRIEIQAGGGLALADLPALFEAGVAGAHLSAKRLVTTSAAGPGGGTDSHEVTDPELVALAAREVRRLNEEGLAR